MGAVIVIGYGNSLRQDDGAGIVLAERLASCWRYKGALVQLLTTRQLAPELAAEIALPETAAVVFVDTQAGKLGDPVEVKSLMETAQSPGLGHQLGPAALMTYVALLAGRNVPAWLVTVPGVAFDHGEGFSATSQAALDRAPALAERLWLEIRDYLKIDCGSSKPGQHTRATQRF
jgi:hydrogenase maturation protease